MEFESVIGLEVHAQLSTTTKMFCRCPVEFGQEPNRNTCPVCLALPGALPTINAKAVRYAILLGLATHCRIHNDSQFARKNYFYPDLPKAYQISQFNRPICEGGWVDIVIDGQTRRIGITRIHMEEDAGKLVHEGEEATASYVDLNRAGTPLLEIVSEPDIQTAAEAKAYMEKIHSLVTYLGICHGNMEKGNLRCDANVSIRPRGQTTLGTRTETKNLNSFRNVQAAIEYEINRQINAVLDGEPIIQQTRLWNADQGNSKVMRSKEDSDDYRYFPCPDLPVVRFNETLVEELQASLPELPDDKFIRFQNRYQLSQHDASLLVSSQATADYFEAVVQNGIDPKIAANWITGDVARLLNEHEIDISRCRVDPAGLSALLKLIAGGDISGKIAKTVFEEMFKTGRSATDIVTANGLKQVSDEGELTAVCRQILTEHPEQTAQYKAGKHKVMGFFVGQAMKQTKGTANPPMVNRIFKDLLTD
jgi:aspartyl-tRNA(Asn)/glutamyl-tRNA(Gln) amidotransferase subunit B